MKRRNCVTLVLVLALGLAACGPSVENESINTLPEKIVPTPVPPRVDSTFETPETLASWKSEVDAAVDELARVRPELYLRAINAALIDRGRFAGKGSDWNPEKPRVAAYDELEGLSAAELRKRAADEERAGEHYAAARIYRRLEDRAGMQRCMAALKRSLEWEAVATIAVDLGDRKAFDKAIETMMAEDWVSRSRAVLKHAISAGRDEFAEAAMAKHASLRNIAELSDAIVAQAEQGNVRLLPRVIDRLFEKVVPHDTSVGAVGEHEHAPELVRAIALLARHDRPAATAYAVRYLGIPNAQVVMNVSCSEGCGYEAMQGTFEILALVKGKAAPRSAYLGHVRDFVTDLTKPERDGDGNSLESSPSLTAGGHSSWTLEELERSLFSWREEFADGGELLRSYLVRVHQSGDPELIALWREQLERIGAVGHPLLREVGLQLLGGRANPDAADLAPAQRLALLRLTGRSIELPENVTVAAALELLGPSVALVTGVGAYDSQALRALWKEYELPVLEQKHRYSSKEFERVRALALKLEGDSDTREQSVQMLVDLLASGYKGELPHLGIYEVAYAELGLRPEAASGYLRHEVESTYEYQARTATYALQGLGRLLGRPYRAVEVNASAADRGVDAPSPTSVEGADGIIRPLLPEIRTRAGLVYAAALAAEASGLRTSKLYGEEVTRAEQENALDELELLQQAYAAARAPVGG